MPKSKLRGGAKAHRKKAAARATTIKNQTTAFQKVLNQQMEQLRKQYEASSATTENQ